MYIPRFMFLAALKNSLCNGSKYFTKCLSSNLPTYGKIDSDFLALLESIAGKENVTTSESARNLHGTDESYYPTQPPDAVVTPLSTDHVSRIMKLCNNSRVPVTAFGTGTGFEGGVTALHGGLCVALHKMTEIVSVNPTDFDATVRAGVTRHQLNDWIRADGLQFPIDPGAGASICGMCATSASGTNAVRYGTMRENVINLEVVLADGTVVHTVGEGRRPKKTSCGYNLTNLFVGSEGTLGIITQATVKLHGIPEATAAAISSFDSIKEAVDTVVQILQCGLPMARIEFLNAPMIHACNSFSNLDLKVSPTLFLEFTGSPASVEEQALLAEELCTGNNGANFTWATEHSEREKLWKARHNSWYAIKAQFPGKHSYSTDVVVPISNLPETIIKCSELANSMGVSAPIVGHVGDGNFHCFIPVDPSDSTEVNRVKEFSSNLAEIAQSYGGSCTGEHGIGLGKRDLLIKEVGHGAFDTMTLLKKSLDPNLILNPEKIIRLGQLI